MIKERFFIISAFNSFIFRALFELVYVILVWSLQVFVFKCTRVTEVYAILFTALFFGILFCIYKIKFFLSDSLLEYFYIVKKYKNKSRIKWSEDEKNLIGILTYKAKNKIEVNINKYPTDLIAKTIKQIYFCTDVLMPSLIYMGLLFESFFFIFVAVLSIKNTIDFIMVVNKVDIFE